MPPEPAPNPSAAPLGDWGDFSPPVPLPPLEAELVEPDASAADATLLALVAEIEGLPPLDAVEVTEPPGGDASARALIDEIEGPPAPVADRLDPETRGALDPGAGAVPRTKPPRAVPVARPMPACAPEPESPFPQIVGCPRCGEKVEPIENRCPWCSKWLVGRPPPKPPRPRDDERDETDQPVWYGRSDAEEREERPSEVRPPVPPLAVVFVSYGLLLGSLIALAVYAVARGITEQADLNAGMLAVGLFDAALTAGALALVWRTAQQPAPGRAFVPMWLLALPMLALLLLLNISYIALLRELFRPFGAAQTEQVRVTFATIFLICALPAVMEEAFFRQLALGVFRRSMSLHAAVWLAAGLFALAHLANPLGMPYLFVAGAAFGYARAYGGLPLAMLLHFLHNFAVVAYEAWR